MISSLDEESLLSVVERIRAGLETATEIGRSFLGRDLRVDYKIGDDPVTEADRSINDALREILPRGDEGWLSEETADDLIRLDKNSLWVVDPIDGTREFVSGIPEWAISIAYVKDGKAVAGGVSNPATGEVIIGSRVTGVTYNNRPARMSAAQSLDGAVVLASRSEVKRGEWERFIESGFILRPVGSIAYKLALVAAGIADATWTLVDKHEWDIAAGVALIESAGGVARGVRNTDIHFNKRDPLLHGLLAYPPSLGNEIEMLLGLAP
ncbi:MAG: 3'(2'),5'-bisphosphate nucleotidase CysQ [Acidobacteriota bacterium]